MERETLKADADLIATWQADPDSSVAVIIHVGGAAEAHRDKVSAAGLVVDRVFRLTNTVSAHGRSREVLALLEKPWVERVELDRTVTTMS